MKNLPANLPALLRKAGLKVIEIDGWGTRGRPDSTGDFNPVGVLNHHTGSFDGPGDPSDDLAYAKWMALTGRSDLPAPLVQLSLSTEAVVYVLAAGRSNHAGVAKASGSVAAGDGNKLYAGIEWMLSGTQEIPAKMYQAAAILNAVLLEVFGSSVQAVSCHYQTSTTGKWDIGDPNGIAYKGARVLNVSKFRAAVQAEMDRLNVKPVQPSIDLDFMHCSLEFKDTAKQHTSDITDIFARARRRGVVGITGTEAGHGSNNTPGQLVGIGAEYGYKLFIPSLAADSKRMSRTDCWVAADEQMVTAGTWKEGFIEAVPGSAEIGADKGRWGPKGVVWVSFDGPPNIGELNIGAGHYLVRKVNQERWNRKFAGVIGDWARDVGQGSAIVVYGGDQNLNDKRDDTFFGSPLTSVQDELSMWEPTHKNQAIDVLATYDHDSRVKAIAVNVLNDKQFPQFHDHNIVEATLRVKLLGR